VRTLRLNMYFLFHKNIYSVCVCLCECQCMRINTTGNKKDNNNNKRQVRCVQAVSSECTDNPYRRSIAGSGRHGSRSLLIRGRKSLTSTRNGHGNTKPRTSVLSTGFGVRTARLRRRHPVESGKTMTQTGTGNRKYPVNRETYCLGLVQENRRHPVDREIPRSGLVSGCRRHPARVEKHLDQDWC